MENQSFDFSGLQPVRLSRQFHYNSKRKAISELKDAFFYAGIKKLEPVCFDEYGYLVEKRKTKSGWETSTNGDIRVSPFPLSKYLVAIYLVNRNGFKIERNDKISDKLQKIVESRQSSD